MALPSDRPPTPTIPAPAATPIGARVAAALFVVYGVAAVINAAGTQSEAGWLGGSMLPRAVVRLFASVVIAWGLTRGARWAWWVGLVAGAIWLAMSAAAVVVLDAGDVYWLQPSPDQIFLAVSLVSLGLALGLLLSRGVRAAFREPRA